MCVICALAVVSIYVIVNKIGWL